MSNTNRMNYTIISDGDCIAYNKDYRNIYKFELGWDTFDFYTNKWVPAQEIKVGEISITQPLFCDIFFLIKEDKYENFLQEVFEKCQIISDKYPDAMFFIYKNNGYFAALKKK